MVQPVRANQASPAAAAALVTHYFGVPADLSPALDLCRRRGIPLIEDCAHAIETGDKVSIDHAATMAALKLATDYRFGRTPTADRVDWHLGDKPTPSMMLPLIQAALAEGAEEAVQFERQGYFWRDPVDSREDVDATYEAESGRTIGDLAWYEVFAALRFAITRITDVYLPSLPSTCQPARPAPTIVVG